MLRHLTSAAIASLFLGQAASADPLAAFDVAEDHTRIFMASAPVHENGMPAHGNAFISQGYIYPEGTLDADTIGVLEDGSPAYPDLVLGTWTCDGYFVGDGGNASSGVWVISRQVFAFDNGETIVTQGTEIAELGVENLRPITGATGEYAEVDGGLIQTTLGFNEFMAINATFELEIRASDYATYPNSPATEGSLEWDSGFPVGPIDTSQVPNS